MKDNLRKSPPEKPNDSTGDPRRFRVGGATEIELLKRILNTNSMMQTMFRAVTQDVRAEPRPGPRSEWSRAPRFRIRRSVFGFRSRLPRAPPTRRIPSRSRARIEAREPSRRSRSRFYWPLRFVPPRDQGGVALGRGHAQRLPIEGSCTLRKIWAQSLLPFFLRALPHGLVSARSARGRVFVGNPRRPSRSNPRYGAAFSFHSRS